jgi:hypothetical protein
MSRVQGVVVAAEVAVTLVLVSSAFESMFDCSQMALQWVGRGLMALGAGGAVGYMVYRRADAAGASVSRFEALCERCAADGPVVDAGSSLAADQRL